MRVLEELLSGLGEVCASFPDMRQWRPDNYPMADVGMAAFSLFFMQSESFLAHRRRLERGRNTSNCQSLFGIKKIPSDNHIRELLDGVRPELLEPCFEHALEQMRQNGGMKDFERLGGRVLIALDGSEYFCSEKRGCPRCLTRKRSNGKTESYHTLLAATLVAPGPNQVLAPMPELIAPRDGAEKQDCEWNAAKRRIEKHGKPMRDFRPVYLGDALFGSQPMCEAVLAEGADFPFVCKQDSHKTLYEFLQGVERRQHVLTERRMGGRTRIYRYRWVHSGSAVAGWPRGTRSKLAGSRSARYGRQTGVPADRSLSLGWKVTYRGAFVTSLAILRLSDPGGKRGRDRSLRPRSLEDRENESFNVPKNHGYHLEHNFGHGQRYLAQVFVVLNLLAFAFHTVCDSLEELWQQARAALGTWLDFSPTCTPLPTTSCLPTGIPFARLWSKETLLLHDHPSAYWPGSDSYNCWVFMKSLCVWKRLCILAIVVCCLLPVPDRAQAGAP